MRSLVAYSTCHARAVVAVFFVLTCLGGVAFRLLPQDALPDTGDRQILIVANSDRSPELMVQQVERPIAAALQAGQGIQSIRGVSEYGHSQIYATLNDQVSTTEARFEAQRAIDNIRTDLPENTSIEFGPDANATGWIYQYVLRDEKHRLSLAQLRDLQDWTIRPQLGKTPGVAEVATIGGFQTQYQVTVDPLRLQDLNINFENVVSAIRSANQTATARVLESGGQNFILRAPSLLKSKQDLSQIVLPSPEVSMEARMEKVTTRPILLDEVALIQDGPEKREGVAAYNTEGPAVGGIVIMRQGENAAAVLSGVKAQIARISATLPSRVSIEAVYDRSQLIDQAISNFQRELLFAVLIVSVIIFLFLNDAGSAIVAILTIPVCLCLSGIILRLLHIELNILTFAGLTLSVGILVDGAIIQLENVIYRLRSDDLQYSDRESASLIAMQEVSPGVFLALSIIVIAFLPLLALTGPEGKLFRPLVAAKSCVMIMAALSAVFLTPALRTLLLPLSRSKKPAAELLMGPLISLYERILRVLLGRPWMVVAGALILIELTVPAFLHLGSEFLPPFEEGTRLFMPTTAAGISISEAKDLIERQNKMLRMVPEIAQVFAKAGHADTATDPAPLSMIETNVAFRPKSEWRRRTRWYSQDAPEWLKSLVLRPLWPEYISEEQLVSDLDNATQIPGVINAWTSPIRGRADMLAFGARTPFVLKVLGPDPQTLDSISQRVARVMEAQAETKLAYAEPLQNGNFLDIQFDAAKLAEAGLQLGNLQNQIMPALGGVTATTIYDGLIPRSVYVRYARDFRDSIQAIESLEVNGANGEKLHVGELAKVAPTSGPVMIRSEFGIPSAYVYVDASPLNISNYLETSQALIRRQVGIPPQYSLEWGGRFEDIRRLREHLVWILPIALLLIIGILAVATRSWVHTLLICLAVPFSLTGCVWSLALFHYKLSAAVWVGIMALLGVDAETGIFMMLFLELEYRRSVVLRRVADGADLTSVVIEGAARRLRPKLMTVAAAFLGLLPILLSNDTGADFTKRLVLPICGGLVSSFVLELLVYPPIFLLVKRRSFHLQRNTFTPPVQVGI